MNPPPRLHHVVFCVEPDNQDAAADVWRTLGFEFVEILLADVLLRVLLDWTRGIEIIWVAVAFSAVGVIAAALTAGRVRAENPIRAAHATSRYS
jgi:hypothetical protein